MFKTLLIVMACAYAFAAPQATVPDPDGDVVVKSSANDIVEIVESSHEHHADGSYSFHYRGEDGTFREETAVVKNPGTEDEYLEVSGSYSFLDTDGKEVVVNYKAGEHGFVPEGNNIAESISVAAREASEHAENVKLQPVEAKEV